MPDESIGDRALPPVLRESGDVGLRSILALLALIGAGLAVMLAVAWLIFPHELADQRFALPLPSFPGPVLQPSPPTDMRAFYAEEMRQLNGTGWQDRARARVHIPIDQAMRAIAAEGIPGWPTSAAASQGDRR